MPERLFPLHEVGSLAKPRWRTKGLVQRLDANDLGEAEEWAARLGISNYHDLVKDVIKDTLDRQRKLLELSTLYGLRLFEKAGLDNVGVGGEQQRVEMYEHAIRQVNGMEFLGHVNSFDYKYFRKAVANGPVSRKQPVYLQEFEDVKRRAKTAVKVPITGPYTLVDWSFNEYYLRDKGAPSSLRERRISARRDFLLDIVANVLRPEIQDLVNAGASWVQIDEPALTTHPEPAELEMFVEAWNETVKGFNCKFSDHTCYPSEVGYKLLAEYAPQLDKCSQLTLEFANRDPTVLGVEASAREGYGVIKNFIDNGFNGEFGVGAVHVHDYFGQAGAKAGRVEGRNIIESPELVRDRLLYASKLVGDPGRVWANPDCGLRTRTWDVSLTKLSNLSQGAELARREWS